MDYLGAVIYALFLFYAWFAIVFVLAGAIWAGARLLGKNQRTILISVVPYAAGSLRATTRLTTPFLLIVAAWVGLNDGKAPALSAKATEHGEYLFSLAFLIYAAVYVPRLYGVSILARLEEVTNPLQRGGIGMFRFFGVMLIASITAWYRGPLCWLPVVLTFAYAGAVAYMTLDSVGLSRFANAPQIAFGPAKLQGAALFLHISDLHVTAHESGVPTGGGRSGLEDLRRIGAALRNGDLAVSLVIISGDLVDRGDEEEWQLAMPALRAIREQGVEVILGPGNHDLLPSYSPWRLLWAAIRPGVVMPVIEGVQVRRYLDASAELAPYLFTFAGKPLPDYLKEADGPWRDLLAAWDGARERIIRDLQLPASTDHVDAFKASRKSQPAQHAELEAAFIAEATRLFPERAEYWQHNLYVVNPKTVAEFFQHDPWHGKWYDPYPLRAVFDSGHGRVEVFVVNSCPRDPLFAQSSLGVTGADQIERLAGLLDASSARLIIIVHHHSFLRWDKEDFRFERWSILSHDAAESHRLHALLKEKARAGRDIAVTTGHTHGASRCGFLPAKPDASHGVWYLESAALGEKGGEVVLVGAQDATAGFHAGLMRRPG